MKKLSFKEYYESKQRLVEQTSDPIVFNTFHDVYKYCKVPFVLNENKIYVSFKPKDSIIVEWERTRNVIIPVSFTINGNIHYPSWSSTKTKTWVETTTTQILKPI